MKIPRATYRLQFNEHFRLRDALALVPYLHDLGISHIYASPLFAACPHSTHGYDVCDFSRLNPELGTENDLKKLVAALRHYKMGLVLDIVPNHMGIGSPENRWWWDVLKNGQASPFANHFDIEWQVPDTKLRGKILLPVLGEHYESVLAKGEIQIESQNGEVVLRCHEHKFPLAPDSIPASLSAEEINSNPAALDKLIQQQHYRLIFYGDDGAALNYRRFFAVNSLAGVRVEDEKVFDDTHALVQKWLGKSWLDGLRVDHPDGLREPENYLRRLRRLAPDQWIVVEKILTSGENLPASWPVDGTTGYDFLTCVNGLSIDPDGEKLLSDFYAEFIGEALDYAALARQKKLLVLNELFPTEIKRLTELLFDISNRGGKDFTREQLCEALKEFSACFPVYRTYTSVENQTVGPADAAVIEETRNEARRHRDDLSPELIEFISDLLRLHLAGKPEDEFVARFQQLTGPAMAKGVEDTAFYCFSRLVSLNEVGGNPGKFGEPVESFHEFCRRQQERWPHSMLATSTHDTKRSEDVRARLNLLSEIPAEWFEIVRRWSAINACHRRGEWPDRNSEYLFYQTLVGAWQINAGRALACMEKSVREAGRQTSWTARNKNYEKALWNFIVESLRDPEFRMSLEQFMVRLADTAWVNSLAQTLIKLTAPGVPDIYQGCELWDFSLVDPDNRRPVDFKLRQRLLAESKKLSVEKIWGRRREGLPKIWLIRKTLKFRAHESKLFRGDYEPLVAKGEKSNKVIAYMRGGGAITVVPRLVLGLQSWGDTILKLPPGDWLNKFTDETFTGATRISELLGKFPVALLVRKEND
jgi:(1->4)-alpha-D-glucan 1-alpha-D-glucosylmutase